MRRRRASAAQSAGVFPRSLAAALLLLGLSAGAQAQDARALERAERERAAQQEAAREAAARLREADAERQRLRAARLAASERLRRAEEETAAITARIEGLSERRTAAEAELARRVGALGPLLPLIQRLSLYPAETLLAVPAPPEDTLLGLSLLRAMTHNLTAEAAAIRTEQEALTVLAGRLVAEQAALETALAAQRERGAELDRALAEAEAARSEAEEDAEEAGRAVARAAERAADLRQAIARIEAEQEAAARRARAEAQRAEAARRADQADAARRRAAAAAAPRGPGLVRGRTVLEPPVVGSVAVDYGARTEDGPAQGIGWQAASGARVRSPCAGRVMYAGPFRSYGALLIVDCGGGYHIVLSGLDRLDARVGASVAAGDAVGAMGAGPRPRLTMELRHNGRPVDPGPWLSARG